MVSDFTKNVRKVLRPSAGRVAFGGSSCSAGACHAARVEGHVAKHNSRPHQITWPVISMVCLFEESAVRAFLLDTPSRKVSQAATMQKVSARLLSVPELPSVARPYLAALQIFARPCVITLVPVTDRRAILSKGVSLREPALVALETLRTHKLRSFL